MRFRIVVIAIGMVIFLSPSLKADTVTFGSCAQITTAGAVCPNADSTKSLLTYANGSLTVKAYGFYNSGIPIDLYVKQGGANETGLGTIIDTADHEITTLDFVNLDLSSLVAQGIFSGVLTLESLQGGEAYGICQGNTVGAIGGGCVNGGSGTGTKSINLSWTSSTDIIGVTGYDAGAGAGADILIQGLNVTPVPEPATLTLLGFGMVGLAGLGRKFAKK